jgi:hypothetical protein
MQSSSRSSEFSSKFQVTFSTLKSRQFLEQSLSDSSRVLGLMPRPLGNIRRQSPCTIAPHAFTCNRASYALGGRLKVQMPFICHHQYLESPRAARLHRAPYALSDIIFKRRLLIISHSGQHKFRPPYRRRRSVTRIRLHSLSSAHVHRTPYALISIVFTRRRFVVSQYYTTFIPIRPRLSCHSDAIVSKNNAAFLQNKRATHIRDSRLPPYHIEQFPRHYHPDSSE